MFQKDRMETSLLLYWREDAAGCLEQVAAWNNVIKQSMGQCKVIQSISSKFIGTWILHLPIYIR